MIYTKDQLKSLNISVLAGGVSDEREVSQRSGKNVYESLRKMGYKAKLLDPKTDRIDKDTTDIAFIALHGTFGEDGTIQSHLDKLEIPYTGSTCIPSLLAMNKLTCKAIMSQHQIPTADFSHALRLNLDLPVVIKPIAAGSSIGVHFIYTEADYNQWLNETNDPENYFMESLIEGQQITVGVVALNAKDTAFPILELVPKNTFYDYDAKYTEGMTEFIIPARLDNKTEQLAKDMAIKLHQAIGCRGFSRTDMIVSKKSELTVLELNTIPGLTDLSDLPAQAKAHGISFDELIEHILFSAL